MISESSSRQVPCNAASSLPLGNSTVYLALWLASVLEITPERGDVGWCADVKLSRKTLVASRSIYHDGSSLRSSVKVHNDETIDALERGGLLRCCSSSTEDMAKCRKSHL